MKKATAPQGGFFLGQRLLDGVAQVGLRQGEFFQALVVGVDGVQQRFAVGVVKLAQGFEVAAELQAGFVVGGVKQGVRRRVYRQAVL